MVERAYSDGPFEAGKKITVTVVYVNSRERPMLRGPGLGVGVLGHSVGLDLFIPATPDAASMGVINSQNQRFFILGEILYDDVFGNERMTTFCVFNDGTNSFSVHNHYNHAY